MTSSLLPVCHKYLATSNNGGWNRTTSIKSYSCTKHASRLLYRRESNPIYFTRPVLILPIQGSTVEVCSLNARKHLKIQCYFELIARDSTWLHLFLKSLRYRLDFPLPWDVDRNERLYRGVHCFWRLQVITLVPFMSRFSPVTSTD